MSLEPGRLVDDRYLVEALLGEGGMATVYRVRHVRLDSRHALKVLKLGLGPVRERLMQEGRLQATLRHPNLVAVTDVVDVDDAPGLVMELVDGPSLEELLRRYRLTLAQVDELATGMLRGVMEAHDRGLIHRDLKPANILLATVSGALTPKVADFGLAKLVATGGNKSWTRSGLAMGTPQYMAPEQIRDAKNVDLRADVFSLGAILYEMICGKPAFSGEDVLEIFTAVAAGRYVPPRDLISGLPRRVDEAITGALETDPDRRFPDCRALLAAWRGGEPARSDPSFPGLDGPWTPSIMASAGPNASERESGLASPPAAGAATGGVAGARATVLGGFVAAPTFFAPALPEAGASGRDVAEWTATSCQRTRGSPSSRGRACRPPARSAGGAGG